MRGARVSYRMETLRCVDFTMVFGELCKFALVITNPHNNPRLQLDFQLQSFLGWVQIPTNPRELAHRNDIREKVRTTIDAKEEWFPSPNRGQCLALFLDSGWRMDVVWCFAPGPHSVRNLTVEILPLQT